MLQNLKSLPGSHYPLGATLNSNGVNFALFSANATKVELCLFDESGSEELVRIDVKHNTNNIWHIFIPSLAANQVYGYRVYGEYNPDQGLRFNHNKLLLDPYARKFVGKLIWNKAIFGYDLDSPEKDLSFSELDSAPYVPKSVVIDTSYDWENDKSPNHSFNDTVVYEAHLRGYTKLHPYLSDKDRGTFKGFSHKAVTSYLKWLGVTAVEFLPIHAFMGNRHKKGFIKDNYWGYESFSFFAPEQSYLATNDVSEIKDMVKAMHKKGIEVILDVVYNHTGEGNQLGPTLSYRGIDNTSYYTLSPENKRYYYDSTGCGASFNVQNQNVLALVMDSLRCWVEEYHVDGFRFDLATTLARENLGFSQKSGFLYAVGQDPVLKTVKLIAEPWDVGYGGYQVGAFPPGWAEWNDKYRDVTRRFWKGDNYQVAEFASRLTGSSDVFNYNNRNMWTSLNFITAHDGFCLNDLVSYNHKHNFSNAENNRDGNDTNWSWNSGAEGEVSNKLILQNRKQRLKAMLSTLFTSFGIPMLLAGDELGSIQFGNNNPYCQDNVLTWINWSGVKDEDKEIARFVRKLIKLRKSLKIFNREKYFTGKPIDKTGCKDITWYTETGLEFDSSDWNNGDRKSLSYCVYTGGKMVVCIYNADFNSKDWILPKFVEKYKWSLALDSSDKFDKNIKLKSGQKIQVPSWSVLIFEVKK